MNIIEIKELLKVKIKTEIFYWKEEKAIRRLFYRDSRFCRLDQKLKNFYRFSNPYHISRDFMLQKGVQDPYVYGETPLTSLDLIAQKCHLTSQDRFLDLGCGRGRGALFLHCRFGCEVIGIDWVPEFIRKGSLLIDEEGCSGVKFICSDVDELEIENVTVIYLAWTCFDKKSVEKVERWLDRLSPQVRVITVSQPLSGKNFRVKQYFTVPFCWGNGEVFLHEPIAKIHSG